MTGSFHPMQIVSVLVWGGLLVSAVQFALGLTDKRSPEFGFSGLLLIGWLTVFSFMSGFSIGLFIAIINIGLGITVLSITRHYRPHFAFAIFANVLLALFMRDTLPGARSLLALLSIGGLVYSFYKLFRYRTMREEIAFARTSLAVVAFLFFLSLLLQNYATIVPITFTLLAVACGVLFTVTAKHYRGNLAIMSALSLAWIGGGLLAVIVSA
ncbi:MAG: hypothetical protein ACRDFQ_09250 [Anaerolineales bacterium]